MDRNHCCHRYKRSPESSPFWWLCLDISTCALSLSASSSSAHHLSPSRRTPRWECPVPMVAARSRWKLPLKTKWGLESDGVNEMSKDAQTWLDYLCFHFSLALNFGWNGSSPSLLSDIIYILLIKQAAQRELMRFDEAGRSLDELRLSLTTSNICPSWCSMEAKNRRSLACVSLDNELLFTFTRENRREFSLTCVRRRADSVRLYWHVLHKCKQGYHAHRCVKNEVKLG